MIPQIEEASVQNINVKPFSSRSYRLGEKRIAGFVDGIEAVRQSVMHILSTERYSYPIYDSDYGVELNQFIGADFGYIEAGVGNAITDALMQDDRIVNVDINEITQTGLNAVQIIFTITTNLGTFSEGILLNG